MDYDVQKDNQKGLLIHCKFEVSKLKDIKCSVTAYFFFKGGTALKANNGNYHAADGQVCVEEKFIPSYEESVYKDFTLFMPYDELHLAEGKHELKFLIRLCDRSVDSEIARSNDYHFRLDYIDNQLRRSIEKVWVEFDTVDAGRYGMKILVKYQVDNLKPIKCQATAFFYSDDGAPLKDTNNKYCSTDGQVCVSDNFALPYGSSLDKYFTLFMPYDELHLKGEHALTFCVRLYNQQENVDIAWSDDYEITFGEE